MSQSKPILCAVPFIEAFSAPSGGWRNCCMAAPSITSHPDQDFDSWWQGQDMRHFRDKMSQPELPEECAACALQERSQGHSMRMAVNQTVDLTPLTGQIWPSRWNVAFGNTCNLACWTCSENGSSVIEAHKRRAKLLPIYHDSAQVRFEREWPHVKQRILTSYDHHAMVTLTILGGEPLYNQQVLDFLDHLMSSGLSQRTRLEFHTNATKFNSRIERCLDLSKWNYVCIFLSLDAVGTKAEWLRYGCKWTDIENNVPRLRDSANYTEVQCTLSVLNIRDLVTLESFCQSQQLPLTVHAIHQPAIMSLQSWDASPDLLLQDVDREHTKFKGFYELVGQSPMPQARQELAKYIQRFDGIRRPLVEFDPYLADILEIR